jgi:serine/threonine-protein kinase
MSEPMTPDRWARIQELFHDILAAPATEAAELLAHVAAGDPDLAAEVRSLIAAEAQGPLGRQSDRDPADRAPEFVGPYRLLRRLGEGGMGVVYLAEREEAGFKQRVALKLLRSGFISPALAEHVAHERRVLARLEHPNIARLIDGGSTPSGQPFLAMEYVAGDTLLEHAAKEELTVEGRLALFSDVCDAVHYAHQQLVIHRDLKPRNIVVGTDGRPRLLDFGVSKLLDPDSQPGNTTRSSPWLTPAYASPEQWRGEAVTTLSDVYSLGVILYELLSGLKPYAFEGQSPGSIERLICETEPPRPSSRCRDPRIARKLEGDLDIIVLKALAKAPNRRYASAGQLAEDLRRYLSGQPVLARPDSLRYRTGKLIRRHRTAAGMAGAALVLALAGVIVVGVQARIAARARDRAEVARNQAQQVTDYVIRLFQAADAGPHAVDTTLARAMLRQGVQQAEALKDQPLVQASMFDALGMVFVTLQRFDQASELVNRAWQIRAAQLPPESPELAESYAHLGRILRAQSRYLPALQRYEQALAVREQVFGRESAEVADTYRDLGFLMPYLGRNEESVRYYRTALTIDQKLHGLEHAATAEDLMLVGLALRRVDSAASGLDYLQQSLAIKARVLGPDDPETAVTRFHVADQLRDLGRFGDAEAMYRAGIESHRRAVGGRDPGEVHGLQNLADMIGQRGRGPEAEALLRDAIAITERRYGRQSSYYADALDELSNELTRQGRYGEALDLRRQGLAVWRREFGTDHAAVAGSLDRIASLQILLHRPREAETVAREALAIRQRIYGQHHPSIGLSFLRLAEVLLAEGRPRDAEPAADSGYRIATTTLPAGSLDLRGAHLLMARLQRALCRPDSAAYHERLAGGG